jgi:hypothetical protein
LICAIWLAVRLLERVLLFGLEETLPVLELLVEVRLDSNSEMIEEASVFEVVPVSVSPFSDSAVVSDAESSGDLHPASINPSKTRQIRNGRNFLLGPPNPNLDKRICVLR